MLTMYSILALLRLCSLVRVAEIKRINYRLLKKKGELIIEVLVLSDSLEKIS